MTFFLVFGDQDQLAQFCVPPAKKNCPPPQDNAVVAALHLIGIKCVTKHTIQRTYVRMYVTSRAKQIAENFHFYPNLPPQNTTKLLAH